MSKFSGIFDTAIKQMLAYKLEVFIWGILHPVSLAVYYFLWRSIYNFSGQAIIRGFTFEEIVAYYALTIILGIVTWTSVDDILAQRVRDGSLVINLVNPISVFRRYFYEKVSGVSFAFAAQAIPVFILGILLTNLRVTSIPNLFFFVISAILALLLAYSFTFLVGLSSFWLIKFTGLRMFRSGTMWFLSGNIVPLAFFPEVWQKISNFLPFQYMSYSPIQIFLGQKSFASSLWILVAQIIWLAIFLALIAWVWQAGLKRFSAVGQ